MMDPNTLQTVGGNQAAGKKRVLFVDDSQIIQALVWTSLKNSVEIALAGDVPQALEFIRKNPLDLLITDYLLPGQNGLDLVRWFRPIHPEVPIILISASLDRQLQCDATNLGVTLCLKKPVDRKTLVGTVMNLLERGSAAPATKAAGFCYTEICWALGDKVHLYCPEIGLLTSAESREQAHQLIEDTVKEVYQSGTPIPSVVNLTVDRFFCGGA